LAASFGGIHNVLKLNQEISLTIETYTLFCIPTFTKLLCVFT
jgi:hypothetical protein